MQVLCIDIGRGTQDILLYENGQVMENCTCMILPSPVALVQEQLQRAVSSGRTPVFYGTNMGGFSLAPYIKRLRTENKQIMATFSAAITFSDYPDELTQQGVKIISEDELSHIKANDEFYPICTQDVNLKSILAGFKQWGVDVNLTGIAVAVQDHGRAPQGQSDRRFRFEHYANMLKTRPDLFDWAYMRSDIPAYLTRMLAVAYNLPADLPLLCMDTGMAAVIGALEDKTVVAAQNKIIVNIGNGHTLAVYLHGDTIVGLWEHHTKKLNADKIVYLINALISGELDNDQIFNDGGHGAFIDSDNFRHIKPDLICLTGPNRGIMDAYGYYPAAPYGNMMLTGSYGLLKAYLKLS